jgi:C-terminal processing protease CtpA/Prc
MPRLFLVAAFLLQAIAGGRQDTSALARTLSFETEHPGGSPAGWASSPPGSAFADEKIVRTGRWSARVERAAGSAGDFSGLSMRIPLDVSGKTIVLRGFLRTEDVTGFVALWLREDDSSSGVAFDTTQSRQIKGTNDWQEHSVTVPIRPEGRHLVFGVLVSGTGKVWADDLELLVDGMPFSAAPKVDQPKTILDTDREFDGGSRVTFDRLSQAQVDNLTMLGKVWGYLKYHHPAVTAGSRHWDYDLFRVLPAVLAAPDRAAGNAAVAKWIGGLGPIAACKPCAVLDPNELHLSPDVSWIEDQSRLGADLSRRLREVHANRPASGLQFYVSMVPGVGNPTFRNEPDYAAVKLPDAGFQLLALYRFWNIIQYWFPYRDVIGENWDDVLRDSVVRISTTQTKPDYNRQLMALIARVHDTHANLWSSLADRPPVGACTLPVTMRFIENRPVITRGEGGLEAGDVVTALDGVPVPKLVQEWSPYYAASNEPTRLRDIARFMTRGPCGESTVGVNRAAGDVTLKVTRVAPAAAPAGAPTHDLPGETFHRLSNDVAYLKLSSIAVADVARYVESAAGTKGLIIDIRNYPSAFVVFELGRRLVAEPTPFARFTSGDMRNPGAFRWGTPLSLSPQAPRYSGKVVILVDEVSLSQAEYTTMAFRVAPDAKVVGSTTAGADGNVSAIPLPGGVRSMISGIGVFYPDKRPTQRIGIVPDVEVKPTIAGIRAGRDEVLEAGIREIVGAGVPLVEIQKMIPGRGGRP